MSWELKYSLQTSCSIEHFFSGVDVWVRRPNVVNRKLSGAVPRLERAFPSELNLLEQTNMTVGEVPESQEEVGVSRVLVRELIPRGSGVTRHELVVMGTWRYAVCSRE